MKNLVFNIISAAYMAVALSGCCGRGATVEITYSDTLYHPVYAEGFDIFSVGKSSVISIYDPWQGAAGVRTDLFLSRNDEMPPSDFGGIIIRAPLRRVVCMSTSHVAFIAELGQRETIKGISGIKYVYNDDVRYGIEMGDIAETGYDAGINYEVIASLEPDIVFLYGVSSESPAASKLAEMGVNAVHIGEFKEKLPLGKAEWLVAFGEMFDLRHGAEMEFDAIDRRYSELAGLVEGVGRRPVVMLNAPWRDTWYMPGNGSYMVRLINDAGGEYAYKGNDSDFSVPISLEAAWIMAEGSDFWFGPNNAVTIDEVLAVNPKFAHMPPVVNGRVYNNNLRGTPNGGSDFWESGAIRPDVILRDMIRILHPERISEGELFYFRRLE